MSKSEHTFHIPVMGLAYTIDSPVKVARFGITSVVSIIQDHLVEQMRKFYLDKKGMEYLPISVKDEDYRARRITAYLDLMQDIVDEQVEKLRKEEFVEGSEISKYFELLPENAEAKSLYLQMLQSEGDQKTELQNELRNRIVPGEIDVNIMTKLDKLNRSPEGQLLPVEFADAMAALRGYARSRISSSIIFSAGLNPRLFAYMDQFPDFFPNKQGQLKKRVILKVSDYRSALIQGKFLAKKGIWVSEFRIESGLNCGGHAFPTEGRLMGPILEEFKQNREALNQELKELCNQTLEAQDRSLIRPEQQVKITVQGGIGNSKEDEFLREYYDIDGTGWGSPFLLVPEATNVDDRTLNDMASAKREDYFMSYASPLGIPFNNFKKSSAEEQRIKRIEKERPGSPCYLKYLAFNNEFDPENPICVSSREYQNLKLKELELRDLSPEALVVERQKILEKDCLCEGLTSTALLKNDLPVNHNLEAVTICPGPNLAYFSKVFSLEEMVGHIYGRLNILNLLHRPHVFMNELKLYVDYMKEEIRRNTEVISEKQIKYFQSFRSNLLSGMEYYRELAGKMMKEGEESFEQWKEELEVMAAAIDEYCSSESARPIFAEVKEI